MADFSTIIQEINDDINTNGVGAITGAKLNEVLRDMIAAVNAEKQDPLTIDATPTEDSTNPVQSGGVFDALEDKPTIYYITNIQEIPPTILSILRVGDILRGGSDYDSIAVVCKIDNNDVYLVSTDGNSIESFLYRNGVYYDFFGYQLSDFVNKFPGATPGDFAGLDSDGNITDSGIAASDVVKTSDIATVATSGSYNDLLNKPTINDVELDGDLSLNELGVQPALVSGTNIKTVNNESLLGSGNIEVVQNLGQFEFESYDATAKADLTNIGDTTTEDINGLTASTDTLTTIVLMPNNDSVSGTGAPTATMMIATQEASTPGTYEFVYIGDLQDTIPTNYAFSTNFKNALIQLLQSVAFTSGNSATLIANLVTAMNSHGNMVSLQASYTQVTPIYTFDSLDDIKQDLVVTGIYEDGYSELLTDYTLSGTIAAGTQQITVMYGTLSTSVSVLVQYKWNFAMGDGYLEKIIASVSVYDTDKLFVLENENQINKRRAFVLRKGSIKIKGSDVTPPVVANMYDTDYYPIPIPPTATKCTIAISPNTQFFGASMFTVQNGYYTRQLDPGWTHGDAYTFSAGQYEFLMVTSKYDSSGTTYPTEPSSLTIVFE